MSWWYPRLNYLGEVASGNGEIWINGRPLTSGHSPCWFDVAETQVFVDGDGAGARVVDAQTGATVRAIGVSFNPRVGNTAGISAAADHWCGWNADGLVYDGAVVSALAAPGCVDLKTGALYYITPYQAVRRDVLLNGTPVRTGVPATEITAGEECALWSEYEQARTLWGWSKEHGVARLSPLAPTEALFVGVPVRTPEGIWIVVGTHKGVIVYPWGQQTGYILEGDWYYPDARYAAGMLKIVATDGGGFLKQTALTLTEPRVDLRTYRPTTGATPQVVTASAVVRNTSTVTGVGTFTQPETPMPTRQQVGFGPNLGTHDLPQLFTESNLWQYGYDRISAFQLYQGHVRKNADESRFCGTNTLQVLTDAHLFSKLKEAGILMELQMAGAHPDVVSECATNIAEAGGLLQALCYDHVFHEIDGETFAGWINTILERHPGMIIGVYAPHPFKSLEEIRSRLVDWDRHGGRPHFLRLDLDYNQRHVWTQSKHQELRNMCEDRGLPVQMIVNAPEGLTDGEYVKQAKQWFDKALTIGKWDAVFVQSWASTPSDNERYLPHNLVETDVTGHTHLLRYVLERFL